MNEHLGDDQVLVKTLAPVMDFLTFFIANIQQPLRKNKQTNKQKYIVYMDNQIKNTYTYV